MTLRRLDKAFAAFFRRIRAGQTPGFPRFKSLVCFSGFNFKSHGDGWRFTPEDGWTQVSLRLSGVGKIRARGQARQGGEIRASEVLHRPRTTFSRCWQALWAEMSAYRPPWSSVPFR